jgi:magnesium transporter
MELGDETLHEMSPVDVSDFIAGQPEERHTALFAQLSDDIAPQVFEYLPSEIQERLLAELPEGIRHRRILEEMSPDDRVGLLDELPETVAEELLGQLSPSERRATDTIRRYPDGTAGRLMTTEFVALNEGLTVQEAIQKIRHQDQDKETVYYAYVTDGEGRLVGVVSLRQLLFSIPEVPLHEITSRRVQKATTDTPEEEVGRLMKRYDLIALPVVDDHDRIVGIVTIDDVVDLIEEQATEDIQRLAGVGGGDEDALAPPLETLKKRLPWLLANIGLYIGAASMIAPFQGEIALVPVLAVIMPVLSNTSGNVAIQALSVTVRGLGVGEVSPRDTPRILRKELLAGMGSALALGLALGLLSLIWSPPDQRWVAIVASTVMAVNVFVAAGLGTLLPMTLKWMKLDPALISGPLLTTILDAVGFFTFLTLVSALRAVLA